MNKPESESPRARYWRSLDELQQTPEFQAFMHREFPVAASEYPEGVSRRRWMQLMGASLALGGVGGCRYSEEELLPFVLRPEGMVPGEPYAYATNFQLANRIYNIVVSGRDGRPLKVEGNDQHPTSHGGTDAYVQASTLGLYDPDRKEGITRRRNREELLVEWEELADQLAGLRQSMSADQGNRLALLTGPVRSPSDARMIARLREVFPQMKVCRWDGVRGDVQREATQAAFGRVLDPFYRLSEAKVIFSLDSDLFGQHPNFVPNAFGFAQTREPVVGGMSRLYVAESNYTNTGMAADTRVPLRPSSAPGLLAALEQRIDALAAGESIDAPAEELPIDHPDVSEAERLERFLDCLAEDLWANRGAAVIAVGEHLGVDAVVAGWRLNNKLEAIGSTVAFFPPLDDAPEELISLTELADLIEGGGVSALLITDENPVHTAPGDIDLAALIGRVGETIYLGEYDDETAEVCDWVVARAHPLESWGDVISDDGYYGVCQPQIRPLLGGRLATQLFAVLAGEDEIDPLAIVRETAGQVAGSPLSNRQWRTLLHDGYSEEIRVQPAEVEYSGPEGPLEAEPFAVTDELNRDDIDIVFTPADGVYDGRFANNAWLQELPQSITKLTWDNAAIMSPKMARDLGVWQGTLVALRIDEENDVELPVFLVPGHAYGAVTVIYGYGRTRAGVVGGSEELGVPPVGTSVKPIRTRDRMLAAYGMQARPRTTEYELATTQDHFAIDELGLQETADRAASLVREGTLELFEKEPEFAEHMGVHHPPVGSPWEEPLQEFIDDGVGPQWGMAIDLSKCLGCNACVVACQAENNVPVVGKEQVILSREMHWLRIDRYYTGHESNPQIVQEPVLCMHCETAPCESVCPVAATVHTTDGINAMVYNRCIGTRYCSNNCPYKVRRFNYFNYNQDVGVGYGWNAFPESLETANRKLQQLVLNPEVTVRGRGVMEKCTYCIQRTERAKIDARKDGGRPIMDGEVKTACQAACPTRAIEFGNLADKESAVYRQHQDPRTYGMLEQLNTKPRTRYLARIRNPHVRLMTSEQLEHLAHAVHAHDESADQDHTLESRPAPADH